MSTLRTTTLKHASSAADNLVFATDGGSTFDGGVLVVDATNNRVGINRNPGTTFDCEGNARFRNNVTLNNNVTVDAGDVAVNTNQFYIQQSTGRVGIGTTSPASPFTIAWSGTQSIIQNITSSASGAGISFQATGTTTSTSVTIRAIDNNFTINTGGNSTVRVLGTASEPGFMALGGNDPTSKLHIQGGTVTNDALIHIDQDAAGHGPRGKVATLEPLQRVDVLAR